MKRSGIERKTPMQRASSLRKPSAEPKPAKGPKQKVCAGCRQKFIPHMPMARACSVDCAVKIVADTKASVRRKVERAERAADKAKKLANPTQAEMKKLISSAQAAVNRVAVLRDWHDGCISCNKSAYWHGEWHGSHYKSVGSNSALRFNLWNISKACADCNWHKSGNIANYVPRLTIKFGAARLDWLQNHPRSREYAPEYLVRLGAVMRKKARRMERRLGVNK